MENTLIFERSDVTPRMVWDRVYYKLSRLTVPFDIVVEERDTKYDLYVPVGTVIQEFNVK
jgi:hypothetical protein